MGMRLIVQTAEHMCEAEFDPVHVRADDVADEIKASLAAGKRRGEVTRGGHVVARWACPRRRPRTTGNPAGRKPRSADGAAKQSFHAKFTPAEHAEMHRRAKAADCSVAEYIRRCCLGADTAHPDGA